jgi:hypothetical protein
MNVNMEPRQLTDHSLNRTTRRRRLRAIGSPPLGFVR